MTYLELCQRWAKETGETAASGVPSAVTGQTGILLRGVTWVADAWREIQNARADWAWMYTEFTSNLVASQATYDASTDFSITNFGEWVVQDNEVIHDYARGQHTWTVWLDNSAYSDETVIVNRPRERLNSLIGSERTQEGWPQMFWMQHDEDLRVYPIPDDAYYIKGWYRQTPTELAADGDTPAMPTRFHDLIWLKACIKHANYSESGDQISIWAQEYDNLYSSLLRDEAPRMIIGRALVV